MPSVDALCDLYGTVGQRSNVFLQEAVITYAHLPAGYIVGTLLSDRFEKRIRSYWLYWFWGLLGSVVPDLDYVYLYLFDNLTYDHHYYPTHLPLSWAILLAGSAVWLAASKKSQNPVLAFMFFLNVFIHMLLDSVPHKMFWLAPFSYRGYSMESLLIKVAPAMVDEQPYWSYSIEAIIFIIAIHLFWQKRRFERNITTRQSSGSSGNNLQ